MSRVCVIYEADGLADAVSGGIEGEALLVEHRGGDGIGCRVLARGRVEEVMAHEGAHGAQRRRLEGRVLIPGVVNAHCHLDLTHAGYLPYGEGQSFPEWIKGVLGVRRSDAEGIRESTRLGIEMTLAGGVVAVGDICGVMREEPLEEARESLLAGVGFIEMFGIGTHEERGRAFVEGFDGGSERGGFVKGMSPHAPYSVGPDVYGAITKSGRTGPIATHVAESIEEREFVRDGTGAFIEVLEMIGAVERDNLGEYGFGWGVTPVEHVLGALEGCDAPTLLVHVNDCTDVDLELLATWTNGDSRRGCVYCPRAHEYFRYEEALGGHRYREMMDAGIPVALGTDSVINLDLREVGERITPLDDARLLFARDRVDACTLLAMITTTPAQLLGLNSAPFTLREGEVAGLAAVDVRGTDASLDTIDRVFAGSGGIELLRGA